MAQDEIETKEEEEIKNKIISLKRKNTDEEVQFTKKDEEIFIEQDNVKLWPCRLFEELKEEKMTLFLAILGVAIVGISIPITGLITARSMNVLNSKYETVRYDDGLKYAMVNLVLAFIQGIGNFLILWKFFSIGWTLCRNYRKRIVKKYLQLHFFFLILHQMLQGRYLQDYLLIQCN